MFMSKFGMLTFLLKSY